MMFQRTYRAALLASVVLGWRPPTAIAIDLTGTWQGKEICTVLTGNGVKTITRQQRSMAITQSATDLNGVVDGLEEYNGIIFDEADTTSKGQAILIACRTTADLADFEQMVGARVTLPAGGAKLKGRSARHSVVGTGGGSVAVCSWTYNRTNTTDPTVGDCNATPAINLGSASGSPGSQVVIDATLVNGHGRFAATSNDIVYDPTQVNPAIKPNSQPDCTINAAIGGGTTAGKALVAAVLDAGGGQKKLRVGILPFGNVNVIPTGLLYSCTFDIASAATSGANVLADTARASNPNSDLSVLGGTDGTITVP